MISIQNKGLQWSRKAGLAVAGTAAGVAAISSRTKARGIPGAKEPAVIKPKEEKKIPQAKPSKVKSFELWKLWIKDEGNSTKVKLLGWFFSVIICITLTGLFLLVSNMMTSNYRLGVVSATIIWALLFGFVMLFILPSKAVTTIFGTMVGIGVGEIKSGANLLASVNKAVIGIAKEIGIMTGTGTDPFIQMVVLIFVGIVFVLCFPSFFMD